MAPRFDGFSSTPGFGSLNSPDSRSWTGGAPDPWDASVPKSLIGEYHFPTITTVTASGSVCMVPGILDGYGLCWGPQGTSDHQEAIGLIVEHPNEGSGAWFSTQSGPEIVRLTGTVYGIRAGLNDPQPRGEYYWTCGLLAGRIPCWGFAGSSSLSIVRVPAALTLASSVSARVKRNTIVAFTAASEPESYEGWVIDVSALDWRWRADPPLPDADTTGFAADTVACNSGGGQGCSRGMLFSGTMYATAYVNGVQSEKSIHVDVKPRPMVKLTVSKDSVTAGDTVFVTTTITNADKDSVKVYDYAASGGPIFAVRLDTGRSLSAARVSSFPILGRRGQSSGGGGIQNCLTATPATKSCFIVPTVTGTLRVTAIADDESIGDEKQIKVRQASLKLACSSVKRGEATTCTATRDDGGAVVPTKWTFSSSDSLMPGFTFTRDDDISSATWTGIMVISGTVHVEAPVGGTTQSADAPVTVSARDWSAEKVKVTINPVGTSKGDPPKDVHDLGSNLPKLEYKALENVGLGTGPNSGLAFFKAIPFELGFDVSYNEKALRTGSRFWSMQPANRPSFGTACGQGDITRAIPLVKKHEGYSETDLNSHTEVLVRSSSRRCARQSKSSSARPTS